MAELTKFGEGFRLPPILKPQLLSAGKECLPVCANARIFMGVHCDPARSTGVNKSGGMGEYKRLVRKLLSMLGAIGTAVIEYARW